MKLLILLITINLQAGDCWAIHNKDKRYLCESEMEMKRSCWKIKDKDLRAYCENSAYGKKSCWKIKDKDLRAYCYK